MITITVIGTPGPQGSKSFKGYHGGKAIMAESSKKVKPWREAVKWAAHETSKRQWWAGDGPLRCEMVFSLARPKSAKKSIQYPAKRPDLDKLIRSTGDALTECGAWNDDAAVVAIQARKVFAGGTDPDALDVPGCVIRIWRAE